MWGMWMWGDGHFSASPIEEVIYLEFASAVVHRWVVYPTCAVLGRFLAGTCPFLIGFRSQKGKKRIPSNENEEFSFTESDESIERTAAN